jgi:5-methylcytosine-specific restriction endonuclease McrA
LSLNQRNHPRKRKPVEGTGMKIGELVKRHIKQIFFHCDNVEHDQIDSLLDKHYSRNTFGIHFPFCIALENLTQPQEIRYWTEVYLVRGKRVRVTSQWYEATRPLFIRFLGSKRIAGEAALIDLSGYEGYGGQADKQQYVRPVNQSNSRYRGNHIGNAQNLFIRNILSSLGLESFDEKDWDRTKSDFSQKCAYCGAEAELQMEHAIPINKEKLGEHRLGNLVPSCRGCNSDKHGHDFKEFLGGNAEAIRRIVEHMENKNYVPLEDNEQVRMVLEMAHKEVADLADRYITIINELFSRGSSNGVMDSQNSTP